MRCRRDAHTDGPYRYCLRRDLDHQLGQKNRRMVWVMLNPSTADATRDDATIRRVMTFTRRDGFNCAVVINLFALVATDPRALLAHPDPVGPDNDLWIERQMEGSARVVVAWGATRFATERGRWFAHRFGASRRLWCLGTTDRGAPRHPLFVPSVTPMVEWDPSPASIEEMSA